MAQIQLSNSSFSFLTRGAIIQEFAISGNNLVLSFPVPELYSEAPFFSETIGRVANRIKDGLIRQLNGQSYQLAKNESDKTHLHGGIIGWGRKTFSGPHHISRGGKESVHFTYISPDGDEGYPGTAELRVWYTPYEENGSTVLEIEYEVELVGKECEETVVNITNHSYFNISGGATIEGTELSLATSDHLVVDKDNIPTGEITTFPGIEAEQPFTLGAVEPAIDHCFVTAKDFNGIPLDTRTSKLGKLISASHPASKIHLEIYSTEPSFQFYTGDYVDVAATQHSSEKRARAGFCIEPGRFVNAVNVDEWKSQVVLRQGQLWGSKMVYKAWKA